MAHFRKPFDEHGYQFRFIIDNEDFDRSLPS
jgi:hypothetical protein